MFEFIESAAFDRMRPLYLDDEEQEIVPAHVLKRLREAFEND